MQSSLISSKVYPTLYMIFEDMDEDPKRSFSRSTKHPNADLQREDFHEELALAELSEEMTVFTGYECSCLSLLIAYCLLHNVHVVVFIKQ